MSHIMTHYDFWTVINIQKLQKLLGLGKDQTITLVMEGQSHICSYLQNISKKTSQTFLALYIPTLEGCLQK